MNSRVKPQVVAVVGYSGRGKTTVLEGLIRQLQAKGLRVAAIKHTVHRQLAGKSGSDTERLWGAGARAVCLASPDGVTWQLRPDDHPEPWSLAAAIPVDLVLVEGFKSSDLPRILVVGDDPEEALTLGQGHEVLAVLCPSGKLQGLPWPTLQRSDIQALVELLLSRLK